MSKNTESITNSLIKLYSCGNSKSEVKFRKKLQNIDWDKEQKDLKRSLSISRTALIVTFVSFIFLFIIFVIVIITHSQSQIQLSAAIAICASCIATSLGFKQTSEKYLVFKLLRELLENRVSLTTERNTGNESKQ
jgi:Trk-type K+ transport system membrane component